MATVRSSADAYRAVWAPVTRVVLGTGVAVLAGCFVLLLPWLSASLLLAGWVARRGIAGLVADWSAVAAANEGLVLLSVALASSVGWTVLLGPPGAALVATCLVGALPVLVAREGAADPLRAWRTSDRALATVVDPRARLWLVQQRARYLDDLERLDPVSFRDLTRSPGSPTTRRRT